MGSYFWANEGRKEVDDNVNFTPDPILLISIKLEDAKSWHGDLTNLEDDDIDLKTMTLRIREGKFGRSAILSIPQIFVQILEQYLQVSPKGGDWGKFPVFYTDRHLFVEFEVP